MNEHSYPLQVAQHHHATDVLYRGDFATWWQGRLHALEGDRKGPYAISVNDQWRICFRFVDGHAYDVEVCD